MDSARNILFLCIVRSLIIYRVNWRASQPRALIRFYRGDQMNFVNRNTAHRWQKFMSLRDSVGAP